MNMMNHPFHDFLDWFILVFLEDILIYFANLEEHTKHLGKVLQRLRQYEIYAKASKHEFLKTSVEFLGQRILKGGMTLTEVKLKAAHDWTTPKDVKDVRSFLGFTNYYRRLIKNSLAIVNPLTNFNHKGMAWKWGSYQWKAFQKLNEALFTIPILLFPYPKLPYIVVMDTSGITSGGVLM